MISHISNQGNSNKKGNEMHHKIRKKKQLTKSNAGEDMEQQECEYTLGKFKWMPPLCKTVRHHLLKRNIFHGTAIPLLDP